MAYSVYNVGLPIDSARATLACCRLRFSNMAPRVGVKLPPVRCNRTTVTLIENERFLRDSAMAHQVSPLRDSVAAAQPSLRNTFQQENSYRAS